MRFGWYLLIVAAAIVGSAQAATIHELIEQGDSAAVATMLDANPDLINDRLQNGRCPLHTAAYVGKLNIVQLLLSRGTDANVATPSGGTALHLATLGGHEATVRLLVSKGAGVNVANKYGYTPMYNATTSMNLPTMKCLMDAGASVNPLSDSAQPPLQSAIEKCWPEGVEFLLEAGADPNKCVSDHGNSISAAVLTRVWRVEGYEKIPQIISLLLEHGANANWTYPEGHNALAHAASAGDTTILRMLLDAGADPDAMTNTGRTAFTTAVFSGQTDAAKYLIARNAYKLTVDVPTGRRPLHTAVMQGDLAMVDAVLSVTSNPNAVDSLGMTPLDYALQYGHTKVAALLRQDGAVGKAPKKARPSSSYLADRPANGEAYLWYLGNCGYLIRTQNHTLVFDYWTGNMHPTEPSLANGMINPRELGVDKLTTFVSHEHSDHFDTVVFGWRDYIPNAECVFGFRPESLDVRFNQGYTNQPYTYIGPGQTKKIDGMEVYAVQSNDAGVGFVIQVDGLTIFHAGDLAGWLPDQRDGFVSQIDSIDERYDQVDIALVNVTGCHHPDTISLAEGTVYTIEKLQPRLVIPTHGYRGEQVYRRFMNKMAGQFPDLKAFCPIWRGDAVKFSGRNAARQVEVL